MENRKINILGTEWKIVTCKEEESELLNGKRRDGCTDDSTRTIWICEKKDDCELQDYESWKKVILRHEILHAFLFESGLDASSIATYGAWANNEEMVDWFTIQSPKIFKVYLELGIIDMPIPSIPPLQTGSFTNLDTTEAFKCISDAARKTVDTARRVGLLNE